MERIEQRKKKGAKEKMLKQKGITLISLVITIIILIILAGVSIGAIFGDNGIITMAKRAKENVEQSQIDEQTELNELYTQMQAGIGESGGTSYDIMKKFMDFKEIIAQAITAKGIETKNTDSAETMAENIGKLGNGQETENLQKSDITFTYDKDGWTNESLTVTVSTLMDIPSGYILQTSTDEETWSDSLSRTFDENGNLYVRLWNGKNESNHVLEEITKIDKTPPTVGSLIMKLKNSAGEDYIEGKTASSNVYIELVNGSDGESGHASTVYNVTGQTTLSDQTDAQTLSNSGTYGVTVITTDVAGNTSRKSYTINIDKSKVGDYVSANNGSSCLIYGTTATVTCPFSSSSVSGDALSVNGNTIVANTDCTVSIYGALGKMHMHYDSKGTAYLYAVVDGSQKLICSKYVGGDNYSMSGTISVTLSKGSTIYFQAKTGSNLQLYNFSCKVTVTTLN